MYEGFQDLVPIPHAPAHAGNLKRIREVESKRKIRFPDDYVEFCLKYGSGRLFVGDCFRLTIFNIGDPKFDDDYRLSIECHSFFMEHLNILNSGQFEFETDGPPDLEEAFPWGMDDQGGTLWWVTEGIPSEWTICCITRLRRCERHELSSPNF